MTRAAKTVGVMGGLGPAATSDFFARLLRESRAARDQDHLHVLIDCDPGVPDRNEALAGRGPSPGPALARMARRLEVAGADFLVLVCNAAHHWEAEIRAAIQVPFLSAIELTSDACAELSPRPARAGVLAADACLQAELYGRALARRGIEQVLLDARDQARFMELLYRIKADHHEPRLRREMQALAGSLAARGAEALIGGCTELSLVLAAEECPVPYVSSTDVLVARTITFARQASPSAGARSPATPEPRA